MARTWCPLRFKNWVFGPKNMVFGPKIRYFAIRPEAPPAKLSISHLGINLSTAYMLPPLLFVDEFVAESHDVHIIRDLISFFFIAFGQGRRGSSPPPPSLTSAQALLDRTFTPPTPLMCTKQEICLLKAMMSLINTVLSTWDLILLKSIFFRSMSLCKQ